MKLRFRLPIVILLAIASQLGITYRSVNHVNNYYLRSVEVRQQIRYTFNDVANLPGKARGIAFATATGGIAFFQTAEPSYDLSISSIKLHYDASRPDGSRLFCIINNTTEARVPLYDWELKPIILYANSQYPACFSLFGEVDRINGKSPTQTEICTLRKNHHIKHFASYHPAFENTLVGLRLLQMDAFYRLDEFTHLPRGVDNFGIESVITGPGEIELSRDISVKSMDMKEVLKILNSSSYTSYIILDDNSKQTFTIRDGDIKINGDMIVYVWEQKILDSVIKEILKQNGLDDKYSSFLKDLITRKINNNTITQMREMLSRDISMGLETQSGFNNKMISAIKKYNALKDEDKYEADPVDRITTQLQSNLHLLRSINSLSYDCTKKVMNYSAFFRFCRNNQENWKNIVSVVSSLNPEPHILRTPNVVNENDLSINWEAINCDKISK